MNNKLYLRSLIMLILIAFAVTAEAASWDKWQASRKIQLEKGTHNYKAFYLDEDVYQLASSDLRDLRVIDQKGEEVPYFIENGYLEQKPDEHSYQTDLVDAFTKKQDSYWDFHVVQEDANKDIIGNIIELTVPVSDFLKQVEILGSYDGLEWNELTTEQIYRVKEVMQSRIFFDANLKYPYYRVRVIDNHHEISIDGLKLIYNFEEQNWRDFTKQAALKYNIVNYAKTTVITIDNPKHLRIKSFHFRINDDFRREYGIYANSHDVVNPFAETENGENDYDDSRSSLEKDCLKTGEIYSFRSKSKAQSLIDIDCSDAIVYANKIRIKINNQNDRPLKIDGIQETYYIDKVVFKNVGSNEYSLFYGNTFAKKPVYDIETYRDNIKIEGLDKCQLKSISEYKKEFQSDNNFRLFFNLVVLLVTVGLVFFIVKQFGKDKIITP